MLKTKGLATIKVSKEPLNKHLRSVLVPEAVFLTKRGWKRREADHPWQWVYPKYPAAHHTLQHAYDIERAKRA